MDTSSQVSIKALTYYTTHETTVKSVNTKVKKCRHKCNVNVFVTHLNTGRGSFCFLYTIHVLLFPKCYYYIIHSNLLIDPKTVSYTHLDVYKRQNCNSYHDKIISYTRYVDDTFMIFNGTCRQMDMLLKYMNNINNNNPEDPTNQKHV